MFMLLKFKNVKQIQKNGDSASERFESYVVWEGSAGIHLHSLVMHVNAYGCQQATFET
jgi:hypothetical protein